MAKGTFQAEGTLNNEKSSPQPYIAIVSLKASVSQAGS